MINGISHQHVLSYNSLMHKEEYEIVNIKTLKAIIALFDKERDYKKEYREYHGKADQIKKRAERRV